MPQYLDSMTGTSQFYVINILRGIAILMMVLFHTLFDISYFGIWPVVVSSGFWRYFAFSTASLSPDCRGLFLNQGYARAFAGLSKKQCSSNSSIAVQGFSRSGCSLPWGPGCISVRVSSSLASCTLSASRLSLHPSSTGSGSSTC